MLIRILFLLSLFISINAYSAAAEKWEYDVIPDQSQRLQIKGHKVDQYGAAVNDYDYNTKIDPKTSSNKFKMGTVGMGRLLKTTGWGLLGSAALEALLNSVDWIIDPATQSIWRNKKSNDPAVGCTVTDPFTGNRLQFIGGSVNGVAIAPFACPLDAASEQMKIMERTNVGYSYKFENWTVYPTPIKEGTQLQYNARVTNPKVNYNDTNFFSIKAQKDPNPKPQEKEYLSPEELADYANHTHPDYSNPDLAPKLEPKYSPSIQTDLWKPSNPWEETNSPTVQEVKKELEKSAPEPKTDPEIKPNPETGGLVLPSFCTWAAPVCEFVKWFKEDPETPEKDELEIDTSEEQELDDSIFSTNQQCPPDLVISYTLLKTHQISFSYQNMCNAFTVARPVVIFIGGLIALFILGGYRSSE